MPPWTLKVRLKVAASSFLPFPRDALWECKWRDGFVTVSPWKEKGLKTSFGVFKMSDLPPMFSVSGVIFPVCPQTHPYSVSLQMFSSSWTTISLLLCLRNNSPCEPVLHFLDCGALEQKTEAIPSECNSPLWPPEHPGMQGDRLIEEALQIAKTAP